MTVTSSSPQVIDTFIVEQQKDFEHHLGSRGINNVDSTRANFDLRCSEVALRQFGGEGPSRTKDHSKVAR